MSESHLVTSFSAVTCEGPPPARGTVIRKGRTYIVKLRGAGSEEHSGGRDSGIHGGSDR